MLEIPAHALLFVVDIQRALGRPREITAECLPRALQNACSDCQKYRCIEKVEHPARHAADPAQASLFLAKGARSAARQQARGRMCRSEDRIPVESACGC